MKLKQKNNEIHRILIKGGRLIDPETKRDETCDVLIEGNKIRDIANIRETSINKKDIIEAKGLWVIPGLIDIHVHLREPGREDEETILSGSKASANGGFTTVCCMANTEPPLDDQGKIKFIYSKNTPYAKVKPVGALSKNLEGKEIVEIGDLVKAGAVAISDDGKPVENTELVRRALEYCKMFSVPVVSHCEDSYLSKDMSMNENTLSTRLGLRGSPRISEEIMVFRDIVLAEMTKGRLHIAHVSTAGSVELIRQAKKKGVYVTSEVTPHHLILTEDAVLHYNTNAKVNPPLRTKDDTTALQRGLMDGTIDCIASDHAPHSVVEKDCEFELASFGMIGLETSLGLILTEFVFSGRIKVIDALMKMTTGPARCFNLPKPSLNIGATADITLIDPKRKWRVEPDKFLSKSRNSSFIGRKLQGKAVFTLVEGKIALKDGKINQELF